MKTSKSPPEKTPIERRDERLKELAEGKLLFVSLALAKRWNDDYDEVLQSLLFICLETHEADVAAGKEESECFLFQTDGYVATKCTWKYRNWRGREMRQLQFGDVGWQGTAGIPVLGSKWSRSTGLDKMALRLDIRNALAQLSPAQIRWCRLLMQGYKKGEAGKKAGGWSPYTTTMQRYKIRDIFAAAGVTP